jgi:hypothetical protein
MSFCEFSVDDGRFLSHLTFSEESKFGNAGNVETKDKICR